MNHMSTRRFLPKLCYEGDIAECRLFVSAAGFHQRTAVLWDVQFAKIHSMMQGMCIRVMN